MKKLLAVLLVLVAAVLVYPCRWRYDHVQVGQLHALARTDRFTGEASILWAGVGWRPANTPFVAIAREMEKQPPEPTPAAAAAPEEPQRPKLLTDVPLPASPEPDPETAAFDRNLGRPAVPHGDPGHLPLSQILAPALAATQKAPAVGQRAGHQPSAKTLGTLAEALDRNLGRRP